MHAPAGKMRVSIQVPPNMGPGRQLRVQVGTRQYDVTIPNGVAPGGTFLMEVAAPPPAAAAAPPPPPPSEAVVPMGLPIEMERPPPASPPPASLRRSETTGRPIIDAVARSSAEMKAECPICFEALCDGPVGVFLGPDGKRVSQHFFNLAAAQEWLRSGSGVCPLTRKRISSVLPVPDIRTHPTEWFAAVDIDGDRRLSRVEVVECLKAQLPIDGAQLDAAVADPHHWMWQQWDADGSGFIESNELLAPQGLVAYVRTAFQRADAADAGIPDISRDKDAWYAYWDEDRSGELDKEEVVRALLKTFRMTSDQAQVTMMRGAIEAIWPVFDDDGSGSIDREEFLKPNEGLADTIIATLGLHR